MGMFHKGRMCLFYDDTSPSDYKPSNLSWFWALNLKFRKGKYVPKLQIPSHILCKTALLLFSCFSVKPVQPSMNLWSLEQFTLWQQQTDWALVWRKTTDSGVLVLGGEGHSISEQSNAYVFGCPVHILRQFQSWQWEGTGYDLCNYAVENLNTWHVRKQTSLSLFLSCSLALSRATVLLERSSTETGSI